MVFKIAAKWAVIDHKAHILNDSVVKSSVASSIRQNWNNKTIIFEEH